MKAITNKEKLPKFLMVNDIPEKRSWNKHLLKPYKKGEIVKVAPFEEQKRNDAYEKLSHYFETDIQILQGLNNDKDLKSDEMILVPIPIDKIEKSVFRLHITAPLAQKRIIVFIDR